MTAEIEQLRDEVRMIRRDLLEIKEMLVPEVDPTKREIKAVEIGRREFARGEFVEWKDLKKKRSSAL